MGVGNVSGVKPTEGGGCFEISVVMAKLNLELPSGKLTACKHLKMDGWNTFLVSFWGLAYFQGRNVSFRECEFCWLLDDFC